MQIQLEERIFESLNNRSIGKLNFIWLKYYIVLVKVSYRKEKIELKFNGIIVGLTQPIKLEIIGDEVCILIPMNMFKIH